jgi:Co/Zn/Cd efflux system component
MVPDAAASARFVVKSLETAPGTRLGEVRATMLEVDSVTSVHDLHAWVITSG